MDTHSGLKAIDAAGCAKHTNFGAEHGIAKCVCPDFVIILGRVNIGQQLLGWIVRRQWVVLQAVTPAATFSSHNGEVTVVPCIACHAQMCLTAAWTKGWTGMR